MDGAEADRVFQAIVTTRSELGLPQRDCSEMRVLIRGGFCVGTVFLFDDGRAFWWLDDGRIEIQDEAGNVLREISLPAEEERRAAA